MPRVQRVYTELFSDGSLRDQKNKGSDIKGMHEQIKGLPGYKKLMDHLVELEINGSVRTVGLFALVPSGENPDKFTGNKQAVAKTRKRVQFKGNDLDRVPDEILVLYINDGVTYYITTNKPSAVIDAGNNPNSLFRIDIRSVRKAIETTKVTVSDVASRNNVVPGNATITISKSFTALFSDEIKGSEDSDTDFSFVVAEEYDPIEMGDINDIDESEKMDDIDKKAIGDRAEEFIHLSINEENYVYDELVAKIGSDITEHVFINENGEQFKPYDFTLNKDIFLEVKGSVGSGSFLYSVREQQHGIDNAGKYFLIKVNGIKIGDSGIGTKYDVIVYNSEELSKLETKPITLKVFEGK